MRLVAFYKFQGFGNDYFVIEEYAAAGIASINKFVKQLCDHHFGAGADGVVTVRRTPDEKSDFTARIFNADGSEAQISGNGTRCAVSYLYYTNQWSEESLRLDTLAGLKRYNLLETIS